MRRLFGIRSFTTKGAASVQRQHFVCKIFHKGNCTNIPQSIWHRFWLRLKLKLRKWDLYAFKSHFLNQDSKKQKHFQCKYSIFRKKQFSFHRTVRHKVPISLNFLRQILHSVGCVFRIFQNWCFWEHFNPLSANLTKSSNKLKQFVCNLLTNCLSVFGHFVGLALKGLSDRGTKKKHFFLLYRSSITIE